MYCTLRSALKIPRHLPLVNSPVLKLRLMNDNNRKRKVQKCSLRLWHALPYPESAPCMLPPENGDTARTCVRELQRKMMNLFMVNEKHAKQSIKDCWKLEAGPILAVHSFISQFLWFNLSKQIISFLHEPSDPSSEVSETYSGGNVASYVSIYGSSYSHSASLLFGNEVNNVRLENCNFFQPTMPTSSRNNFNYSSR